MRVKAETLIVERVVVGSLVRIQTPPPESFTRFISAADCCADRIGRLDVFQALFELCGSIMNTHDNSGVPLADPPPPYPDPSRRHHRSSRSLRLSLGSHLDSDAQLSPYSEDDDEGETSESSPFLPSTRGHTTRHYRHHSSHASRTSSRATSLTHTVLSLFRGDDDDQVDLHSGADCADAHARDGGVALDDAPNSSVKCASCGKWKTYFVPLRRRVYYRALFHLLVLNFPYALIAWVYLFVFTVVCSLFPFRFHT
jgi:hypothetical protein